LFISFLGEMLMKVKAFSFALLWMILVLAFMGCQSDKGKGGKVSGHVTLEGATSHAGITVELFGIGSGEPIWAVQSSHPCIGFPYSPEAEFDWRLHQPLYGTTTDAGGNFNLSDVPNGVYVVCTRCDSFGWSAPITVSVQGADVAVNPISLYRETYYGFQSLQQNTTFEEDHHYVLKGIINVDVGVTLTINPGAVIRFDQDQRMIVKGTLIATGTPEKWIVWTCQSDTVVRAHWYMVQFTASATPPQLSYNRFEGADQAVVSSVSGGSLDHCFFRKMNAEALTFAGENPQASNCIFYEVGGNGVRVNVASDILVESNLFYANDIYGVMAYDCHQGDIRNNWFENCGVGGNGGAAYILLNSDVRFNRNRAIGCNYGIYFGSSCDSTNIVQSNHFSNVHKGILIGLTPEHALPSFPTLNFNCFVNVESYCLQIASCQYNTHNISAQQNYWGTASESAISACIWHNPDENLCPFVIYSSYLSSCPDSAGITC
jgi:hypothetical protein